MLVYIMYLIRVSFFSFFSDVCENCNYKMFSRKLILLLSNYSQKSTKMIKSVKFLLKMNQSLKRVSLIRYNIEKI